MKRNRMRNRLKDDVTASKWSGLVVVISVAVTTISGVVSAVVACLSLSISGYGATVAVAVSISVSMTIESSIVTVYAGVDLLIGYFSHFGLLGDGRSQQNSQNDLIISSIDLAI